VLDRVRGTILQASASVRQHLDAAPALLLGQRLEYLVRGPGERLHERLRAATQAEHEPQHLGSVAFIAVRGRFELVVHRHGGYIVGEFEPSTAQDRIPDLGDFADRARRCGTADELRALAVEQIRKLTGFGYVGAHARDAGRRGRGGIARLAYIPDTRGQPSPLVPSAIPAAGRPVELGFAALRAASPALLRRLESMGTRAAMSLPLSAQGRLGGTISCRHGHPHAVPLAVRAQCGLLAQIVALQIEARQTRAEADRCRELRRLTDSLLAAMARHDSVPAGLASAPDALLEFGGASGAAVVHGDECLTFGRAPPRRAVQALAARLARTGGTEPFHTSGLPALAPEFAPLRETACGVLAISICASRPNQVLWFRPERPPGAASRRPGRSRPWQPGELQSAAMLRAAIAGTMLRKAEELAGLADELGRINQELEAFSYSVSHDLRAPLRHIAGYADLLWEYEGKRLSARGTRYLETIGDSARFAGHLVDALLTFSQMGRSALRPVPMDLSQALAQIRRELAPDLHGRNVEWIADELPPVHADPAYVHLALRNLLSNAIKYTRGRDPAVIEIAAEPCDGGHVVSVRDNGVGFDMKYVGKLFGVFQRLHHMEDFEGTGIGLANVRRIVERHGGRVWAEGEPGTGAAFHMFFPGAQTAGQE